MLGLLRRGARVALLFTLCLPALSCEDAEGVPDDLEQACRQLLDCDPPPIDAQNVDGCRQELSDAYDEAAMVGCADVYTALVSCYGRVPLVCSMQGPGSCEDEQSNLDSCRDEAEQGQP